MSCETLSAQPIRLTVTVGNLPEGYCPASFQQFATDFASRLIVTPNQNNSTFVTGSIEPTSNVGPWLKNCLEWFVFDDSTGRYIPTRKGGFDSANYYTSSDAFIVPDFIYKLEVEIWGAGGGGAASPGAGSDGAGGGAGAYAYGILNVTPGQAIIFTVGSGGAGGTPGAAGGSTNFLTMNAGGGAGGVFTVGVTNKGGDGGIATGGLININGQSGNSPTTANKFPGLGGSSPNGGPGGMITSTQTFANGQAPGGGGAGQVIGTAPVGNLGNGANGAVFVKY